MKQGDYKIGTRLLAGFILMLLLSLTIGGMSFYQIWRMSDITEQLYQHPYTVNTSLRDLRREIHIVDAILADLDPGVSITTVEMKKREIEDSASRIQGLFSLIGERYLGDKNDIRIAQDSFKQWRPILGQVFTAHLESLGREVQLKALADARQHAKEFLTELQVMIDFAGNRASAFHQEAIQERDSSSLYMVLVLACSVLAAGGVAILISRGITLPLREVVDRINGVASGDLGDPLDMQRRDEIGELADSFTSMREGLKDKMQVAQAVANGDLSKNVTVVGEKDLLGNSLDRMIKALRLASEDNTTNDWIKTGKNELAVRLTGELDLPTLASRVVSFLAQYVTAQVGAFYVLGTDDVLTLTGSYAFTMPDGKTDAYQLGQGLVGQVALEGKPLSVLHLPGDYIRVHSALGNAQPKHIVVLPLLYEGRVKGVLELGSFEEITEVQMDFLISVSDSIGLGIATVENQVRLRELLEKTQLQAESLQSQQEELRSVNEELEQQAQALRTSEEELRQQQEELQAANEELGDKNEYLERQKAAISLKNVELDNIRQGLEQKAKELELSSQYKSEFLANMSHELRTPLNSLLLLSRSLMDNSEGNLSPDQVEYARIIHRSGNDLLDLINDILNLSKIEAGKMTLRLEEMFLAELAASLTSSFKPMIDEKGLTLNMGIDEDLPKSIRTDPQRTEQILRNLISNAVKFCDKGGITVRLHRPEAEWGASIGGLTPEQAVAISVKDTGVGIPADKHKEIFEAFQQLDGGTNRKYGGTGLGLTISRELAQLLGGEIRMQSVPGQGSTFTLILPLDFHEAPPEEDKSHPSPVPKKGISSPWAEESATDVRPLRQVVSILDDRASLEENEPNILIIEDDPDFARILSDHCHAKGFKVLAAATGEDGLKLARKIPPVGIILDIKLPDMSGWQVLDMLKNDPGLRHIPVHVMSGVDGGLDALRRGAVGFLSKPASQESLSQAFGRMEEVMSKKIKDLLLVEDDDTLRRGVIDLIRDPGVNIVEASTGSQAIALLKGKRFDCMILDLGLPDMSGFDLLEHMEPGEEATLPPVIVYTGRELTREEERRLQTHADSIIIKGVRSEERLIDETALFLHQMVKSLPARKRDTIMHLYDKDAIFKGRTVLLVDDDMRNLFALSQVLRDKGLITIKAEDGQKAIDILSQDPSVDLVLMDIMMPGMDGYETTRRIRSEKRFQSMPIIALTAKAMLADRGKCIAAGASDYLSKPVDLDRLLSVMRVWLHK